MADRNSLRPIRRIRPTAFVLLGLMLTFPVVGQPQTLQQQQSLQRQFQKLIQQIEQENADIGASQAAFGEEGLKQTRDAIKGLVETIRNSQPSEDVLDLKDWFEFADKLGELVHWYGQTLDDIGDSANKLGEIDAKLGQLKQRLAEDEVAVKERVDTLRAIDRSLRNYKIKLQPLPEVQGPDWSQLDQAIEDMRQEDQLYSAAKRPPPTGGPIEAPCSSLLVSVQQSQRAIDTCTKRFADCIQTCTTGACIKACGGCDGVTAQMGAAQKAWQDCKTQAQVAPN